MPKAMTLSDLSWIIYGMTKSTDITVRQSISIDSTGNPNTKFSILHKRWIHGETAEEVLSKWKKREGLD